jgi:hypothetical protein
MHVLVPRTAVSEQSDAEAAVTIPQWGAPIRERCIPTVTRLQVAVSDTPLDVLVSFALTVFED